MDIKRLRTFVTVADPGTVSCERRGQVCGLVTPFVARRRPPSADGGTAMEVPAFGRIAIRASRSVPSR